MRRAVAAVPVHVDVAENDGRVLAAERAGAYDRILARRALHRPRRAAPPARGALAQDRRPTSPSSPSCRSELLDAALGALAPGGILAYVTCSPHLAETVGVVRTVLRDRDDVDEIDAREIVRSVSRSPIDLPAPASGSGHAQLWPHRHGTDAMFLSLIRKRS